MTQRPMKTSHIWKLVRDRIADNRSVEIDSALANLEFRGEISLHRRCELTTKIRSLLRPAVTYKTWIRLKHPKLWGDAHWVRREKRIQEGQLAWLDHLIAEAKAKGD